MKNEEKKLRRKNVPVPIYKIISTIVFVLSIGYLTFALIKVDNIITSIRYLTTPLFITVTSLILFVISIKGTTKKDMSIIFSIIIMAFITFNFMNDINLIKLPQDEKMISYVNKSYKTLNEWAEKNHIKLNIKYETNEEIEEGNIIRLDISEGTLVKDIKEITATISEGPNYDKIVVVPSMIGWNIDDVVKFIDENHIIGAIIEYEFSDETKDTIIKQEKNGDIRRDQEWVLTASLGKEGELEKTVTMIDLTNMNTFNATLWLKKNNIKYITEYEFNNDIKRNIVTKQNIKKGEQINIDENEVTLIISKGKAITVPNLLAMTVDEITNWIIENKLKVSFEEIYDEKVEVGKVINTSVKEKEKIEIGTLLTITISKGQIKMQSFNSLYEFKTWANKYSINYNESYEYSDGVGKGNIISFSYKENEIVNPDDVIYVKISLGKAIIIPTFAGMSKTDAASKCNNIGIKCAFIMGNYTDYKENIVYAQSRGEGTKVTSGSTITLTLSKGIPTTKKLSISQSWLSYGNADATITSLKTQFAKYFPGVIFEFKKVEDNTTASGLLSLNSPTSAGSLVTQGNTYTIYIVSN